MKNISIEQLDTVTGGTAPAYRHYVTSARNPFAIESINLSKGGLAVIRQFDGSTVNLHVAPKGAQMH